MTLVPQIILGPPGTGKTTTLLGVVEEELARGTPPGSIGLVTFTRRGAEEAISRAATQFNLPRKDFVWFRTIHSICFRALGLRSGDVMERKRMEEFSDYVGMRISGKWAEDGSFAGYEVGDRALFMENLARMRGIPLSEQYNRDSDNLSWRVVEHVAASYAKFKATRGLMDYTDMLIQYVAEDRAPEIDVLGVDEAQDLSALQWRVVRLLQRNARRLVIAGDDDQALYRWAGADVDTLIDMPGDVRVLSQSWRVPARVQVVAGDVISRVKHRRPKEWLPRPTDGLVDRFPRFEQVDLNLDSGEPDDGVLPILILARNQYILREQIEPDLQRRGIVYEINGYSSVRPSVLSAIVSWEALRAGKSVDADAAAGVYKWLTAGVGVARGAKASLDRLKSEVTVDLRQLQADFGLLTTAVWHEALDKIPRAEAAYMQAARRAGQRLRERAQVHLSTIHGSKGGQAKHVVLLTEMARRSFVEMRENEDDEHRVYYVGATRARERLTIVGSSTKQFYPWV